VTLRDQLLDLVPDAPAWVDTRGVLLENSELFGDASGCIGVQPGGRLLVAVGEPPKRVFAEALARADPGAELLATAVAIPCVQRRLRFEGRRALIHSLVPDRPPRDPARFEATLLRNGTPLDRFPDELQWEAGQIESQLPVAVVLEEGEPVSICFPALVTERYWDVAVETVEGLRRGGRAAAAFMRLEVEMRCLGREPVWGAVEDNVASRRLAERLGFAEVGEVATFELSRRTP
jgi:hypothetical protein